MLEINAWKREKDLSHQQQSGVIRGAGKNNLATKSLLSLEWKHRGIPESFKSYLTSTFLTHLLAHAHSFEKHVAGNPSKASTSQR